MKDQEALTCTEAAVFRTVIMRPGLKFVCAGVSPILPTVDHVHTICRKDQQFIEIHKGIMKVHIHVSAPPVL